MFYQMRYIKCDLDDDSLVYYVPLDSCVSFGHTGAKIKLAPGDKCEYLYGDYTKPAKENSDDNNGEAGNINETDNTNEASNINEADNISQSSDIDKSDCPKANGDIIQAVIRFSLKLCSKKSLDGISISEFLNNFQGKLAEFAVYKYFNSKKLNPEPVDLRILPDGDDEDIICAGKSISVKSRREKEQIMALKLEDTDKDADNEACRDIYKRNGDMYYSTILVRVRDSQFSELEAKLKDFIEADTSVNISDTVSKINNLCRDFTFEFNISGFINQKDMVYIYENNVLEEGSCRGIWVKDDDTETSLCYITQADRICYARVCDLRDISELIADLQDLQDIIAK